jgi:hypothetical protein
MRASLTFYQALMGRCDQHYDNLSQPLALSWFAPWSNVYRPRSKVLAPPVIREKVYMRDQEIAAGKADS